MSTDCSLTFMISRMLPSSQSSLWWKPIPRGSHPSNLTLYLLHSNEIPKIICGTQGWTDSCIKSNPKYQAKFMTDEAANEYVKNAFASCPDIIEAYLGLTVLILKADLLRYLLLFDQGGIRSDLDISSNAGVVVGWEFDMGWKQPFVRQFASWTIMAKPGSFHMLQVIEDKMEILRQKMHQYNMSVENITLEMTGYVVDFSGPRRLTFSIFKRLERTLNRTVTSDEVSEILQPKLIGDVLVMPGRSFAASANVTLVTHHYAGTWKNSHGGESSEVHI
ncbi:glycosyltransferase family 32 protein [Macroventuria anomochaeta]|uniref:Glycosyltransferase family 32 protein n=1 Tax=Macroventuria anomochaeta TaxID=301207 RepID=A0ACB6RP25_9PLEO|nr:glycosyltransferase family 32 protein [Macroventuria anomochaeta]KAF2623568.1 glycosyltransferase family 32 protein [Macroventuria anomochaeta]